MARGRRKSRLLVDAVKAALATVILVAGLGVVAQVAGVQVAGAAAPTITAVGHGSYNPTGVFTTTVAAGSNGKTLPQGTLDVASTSAFPTTYNGLTVQTSAGPEPVYCYGTTTATTFTSCSGGTGIMSLGGFVTSAAVDHFDVYTLISGGAASVDPSSLTILNDVPAADRGMASSVTATATNGIITYVQSAAPTGTFSITFGICATGVATYSVTNANCTIGSILYGPSVGQVMGDAVTVSIATSDVYQTINIGTQVPSSVAPNQLFTAYASPTGTQVPADQSTPLGNASLTDAYGFTAI